MNLNDVDEEEAKDYSPSTLNEFTSPYYVETDDELNDQSKMAQAWVSIIFLLNIVYAYSI